MQFCYLAETCRRVVFKCPYKNKSAVTVPWDSDDIRPRTVLLSGHSNTAHCVIVRIPIGETLSKTKQRSDINRIQVQVKVKQEQYKQKQ